jgi:hypothetical protein
MKNKKVYYVDDSAPAKRISAYVILDSTSQLVGKLHVLYPKDGLGRLRVTLYDWTKEGQLDSPSSAQVSGWGYNKLASAMSYLKFAGIKISDPPESWEKFLEKSGYKVKQVI